MKGYMYILECVDGSYYTGSTNDLELRMLQHQNGEGANHTKKRLPITLVYYEEFDRIDEGILSGEASARLEPAKEGGTDRRPM